MSKLTVLFLLLLCSPLQAANRHISPSGTDSGDCTNQGSPCKTFSYATAAVRLVAGDTLFLANGTYSTAAGTGLPSIICSSGAANNGTASLPITIKATNERQAFLSSTGANRPFHMSGCSYWIIEGLRGQSADLSSTSGGDVFGIFNSHHLTIRRNLVSHPNRYANAHGMQLDNLDDSLVEENEVYAFHRHGLSFSSGADNNIIRRNYIHSRLTADIPGGNVSAVTSMGDEGIAIYPGSNNIIENNISEESSANYTINASGTSIGNRYYGNISIDGISGWLPNARGNTLALMPQNTVIDNCLVYSASSHGMYIRSAKNTQITNATILSGSNGGIVADKAGGAVGDNNPSIFVTNSNASGNSGTGFWALDQTGGFTFNFLNSFGNGTAFSPAASDPNITNESTTDPNLGSCRAWIPSTSPMKGAGLNGNDIGTNILYKYQNGVLTSDKLWNTTTNDFVGCGVVVAGVNDSVGNSCTNVDIRLNIGAANGCAFPAGYGVPSAGGGPWVATEDFESYSIGASLSGGAGGSGWNGNWIEGTPGMTVQAAPPGMTGKAAFVDSDPDFSYTRAVTALTAGIPGLKVRMGSNTPGNGVKIVFDEAGTGRCLVAFDSDGFVKIVDNASTRFNVAPYSANTTHIVQVEFDDATQANSCRARVDFGNWSQWFLAIGSSYDSIDRIRIASDGAGFNTTAYFDDIGPNPSAVITSTIALVDAGVAGVTMHAGTVRALEWDTDDYTGNIDLFISRDNGATFQPIALGVPDTSSYNWTVTGPATTSAKIKTCLSSNPTVCDTSETFGVGGTLLHIR